MKRIIAVLSFLMITSTSLQHAMEITSYEQLTESTVDTIHTQQCQLSEAIEPLHITELPSVSDICTVKELLKDMRDKDMFDKDYYYACNLDDPQKLGKIMAINIGLGLCSFGVIELVLMTCPGGTAVACNPLALSCNSFGSYLLCSHFFGRMAIDEFISLQEKNPAQ